MPTANDAAELRVLVLSDNRPGHYNLSKGIVAAIATHRPVAQTWLEVRRGRWPGWLTAAATNANVSPAQILSWIYGLSADAVPPADLIVSAGAETLAANIAIARLQSIPNIFYGSLRRFRPRDFALVLTSYQPPSGVRNIVQTLKPSAHPHRPLSAHSAGPRYGLLVGGPTSGIDYTLEDWSKLIAAIKATTADEGITWLVSNSRRTPADASTRIADLAATHPSPIEKFLDVRSSSAGSLEGLLERSSAVVVTADSSSMISEAIWAGRPVIAVTPAQFKLTANERGYRQWLADRGWLAETTIQNLTGDTVRR
ncbi:MAG: mitochondrial fission ELM1 family protein, partial [Hyphomicrobiaceae bacterium]|nr:mitochondrial fission ELM1 family protein [Hyphomicrobiaceae bacterium]